MSDFASRSELTGLGLMPANVYFVASVVSPLFSCFKKPETLTNDLVHRIELTPCYLTINKILERSWQRHFHPYIFPAAGSFVNLQYMTYEITH